MKLKTSELEGSTLDWAVAKCLGHTKFYNYGSYIRIPIQPTGLLTFCPSTDWELGGPIIEREFISIFDLPSGIDVTQHPTYTKGDLWEAEIIPVGEDSIRYCGPTPLIAAMRCYVASKLGDEVEIPDTLLETA